MLQVDPNLRPSCKQILEIDFIQKKAFELGINYMNEIEY